MSAQETTDKRVKDLTEAVSTNLASLFTELIRVSVPQAPPHAPPQEPPNTNINKKVLRKLESMSLQIGSIRSDLRTVKAQTDYERQAAQEKLIEETNLIDLLDLSDTEEISEPAPVEKYNELARAHNRELAHVHDLIAPLHNPRGNPVFGFPATVGDLISLHSTAEKLLCAAFGLKYEESSATFVKFCGFDPVYLEELGEEYSDYIGIASKRVENFYKRQTDIETTGKPTVSTRKAAADHNVEARRYNARAGSDWDLIKPIHDGRNLAVPGFPSLYGWFMTPHEKDVLYLLGEYGLSTEPEGCMQRFEDFVGVPKSEDRDKGVEWYL